jgi:hypothetical protein
MQIEGIHGISDFWLSQKIGLQKGADPAETRMFSSFAKGLRGPGLRKSGDFVLSDSLLEKLDSANRGASANEAVGEQASVPVPRLTDPAPVDWAYLRKLLEQRAEQEARIRVDEEEKSEGGEVEEVNSGEGGEEEEVEAVDSGEVEEEAGSGDGEESGGGEEEPEEPV